MSMTTSILRTLSRTALPRVSLRSHSVLCRAVVSAARVMSGTRAFSVSARRLGSGESDSALVESLKNELKYERENVDSAEPDFLKEFKGAGVWTIEDTLGNDEVVLTRKFGDESIRVIFSIADIQNQQDEFEDENENEGSEGEEDDKDLDASPIRASLSVTKSTGQGSLNVDTSCQDGTFVIENVSYYPTAKLGTELTAEADWQRRGLYIGPQFDALDSAVQEQFDRWLYERGVNENLALFIPEYAEYKEQREYVRWLENVNGFIDA